ncbi:phage GP46 family protein [Jeongeupia naejangsanensis]|uniref:Phage GP46 family protein n=1 Tax=Jeongeupia naejangsanensis TaxID=613195 RepID=A0ABS2BHB2_9NEIS|nr:phage GP46 family protein [Jeongeupia naejangsanensis]MBM3114999.1 phage GP46 family protein [Jeongeupia naejangsanensis]
MTDLLTRYLGWNQGCDWRLSTVGLEIDNGLDSAVTLSLFTDRRAEPGDNVPGDPRGWWGDAVPVKDERVVPLGSRLWLLAREKQLPSTLRRAEDYAREALQWLIDDGVAGSIIVAASAPRTGMLQLDIRIDARAYQFEVNP